MADDKSIAEHYKHGSLLRSIEAGLSELGKTADTATVEDLGPVDEFHIGGRPATEHFLSQLKFGATDRVLDVGCGLGGAARFVAQEYKSRVTGIDLVQEYIDTGNVLSQWVKLDDKIKLVQGSANTLPFDDNSFSGAYMLHVGMNIEDKDKLFHEVYRVLKPGASFGVYDIMRDQDGDLTYPVPWAAGSATSFLKKPDEYKKLLEKAGFSVVETASRRDFALDFFKQAKAKAEASGGPPPLGLHTLMQAATPLKLKNLLDNIAANLIAPVEIIAKK